MNEQQKLIKRQKGEIKRLNNENDNQRRTLSRYQGIRRFTMQATDNTKACQTDTLSDHLAASGPVISNEFCQDEIDLTRAKLNSLCDHVRQVAGSLLSVIDQDTDSNFTLVTNRKNNSQRNKRPDNRVANTESNTQAAGRQATRDCPVGAQASATQAPPTSSLGTQAGPRRQTNAPGSQTTGRRIPVVQLGASGSVSTNIPPTYSHIVHQGKPKNRQPQVRRPSPSDTIVIGTSLMRGVGGKLHKFGVNATSYTYAGTKVEHIRNRIPHILNSDVQPKHVILQCGGNDAEAERADSVMRNYEQLIDDVRGRCPNASIVLCTVPPRGENRDVLRNIDTLNSYLQQRATCGDNVWCIDICPKSLKMYRRDKVHFNKYGLKYYAKALVGQLSNFSWPYHHRNI